MEVASPFFTKKAQLSLMIFKMVDAVLLYSENRKKIITDRLGDSGKLFVANNTLDTDLYQALNMQYEHIGKNGIRAELELKEKFHLIYIGRLLSSKRIDLILSAFDKIADWYDVGLHFIGDGLEIKLTKEPYYLTGFLKARKNIR